MIRVLWDEMKKGHIRILVVVMSAALLGLLAVQWFWVRNAVAMREKQFQHRVMASMETVVERLQENEISIAMNNGVPLGLPFIHPANWLGSPPERDRCSPLIRQDSTHAWVSKQQMTTRRSVNGQWVTGQSLETRVSKGDTQVVLQQRFGDPLGLEYVHGFVERLLQNTRPIQERINFALLDSLIKQELKRREVDDHYVYGIEAHGYVPDFVKRQQQISPIDHDGEYYRIQLFPHDFQPSEHFLELQFPGRTSPTLQAMGLVLPTSGILVIVVMACFGIALLAFRRQQKLSDLKTDFINNMTHELKTPISTISLALEALGDPDMQTKERIGLYARVIGQENERLKTQVERVLQAAALERGELKLDLHPTDLDTLVREQIERIRLHVENRGGQIVYVPDATDTRIRADEVHLGGVIFNLLDNANKYSPERPQITVRTTSVSGGVEVAVTDNGLGIDGDAHRRVFEKFYRVPTGNVHDVKGFGIGLSYARSMARAHGGDITLKSDLGKGATFTLFIPQNASAL